MSTTIVINPDEDYGMVNEEEAAMFLNDVRKTETVVRAAQKERGAKEGELVVRAVMEHFVVKENGRNIASAVPAKTEERMKLDKSGKYNAGIPLQATIEEFDRTIPGLCEKRTDGQAGWRVKWSISHFKNAEDFLLNPKDKKLSARSVAAWQAQTIPEEEVQAFGLKEAALQRGLTEEGLPNDPLSVRIRQCVNRDGTLVKEMWINVERGESARFKGPDNKGTLLRTQGPSGAYVVQTGSPLIFNHVVPTIYVTFDDPNATSATTTTTESVPALPPTADSIAAAAASAATQKPAAAASKKKEASLGMIFCYECKGSVLLRENKDASDLCASERMHFARNKDAHQLVPIHLLRAGTASLPKSVYFFVAPRYITRWNPEHPEFWPKGSQGISLFRSPLQQNDLKSNPNAAGEVFYSFVVDMAVFQWKDKPNTQERYVVNARVRREDDVMWRSWGITNGEAYAAIMSANQDIPFHVTLNFWKKATMERPANDPKEMNRNEGTENIRGYYDFIIDSIVPDYRRYFPARGMHLSRERVEREFENYISFFGKNKTKVLALQPYAKLWKRDNPLHTPHGLLSAVLSLGNGQPAPSSLPTDWPKLTTQEGFYHACSGDITHLMATPGDRYQFYVLTSRPLTEEDRAQYCGPNGVAADDWLDAQIEGAAKSQSVFYYWIFALDMQSKLAVAKQEPKVTPPTPSTPSSAAAAGTKREREEEETAVADRTKVAHVEEEQQEGEEEEVYE